MKELPPPPDVSLLVPGCLEVQSRRIPVLVRAALQYQGSSGDDWVRKP